MKRIATAVVLAPLTIASLALPNWVFSLVIGAITIAALREYLEICSAMGLRPFRRAVFFLAILWFLSNACWFGFGEWGARHGTENTALLLAMFPVNAMNTVIGISIATFLTLALGRE